MQLFAPSFFYKVESFLEIIYYSLICSFGVSVTLLVTGACGLNLDLPLVAEFLEYF